MHRTADPTCLRQSGFTLVELMVGMVIALLATLVVAQTLVLSEGQKRSTTNGTDAQINGALSLYTLQRAMQMAGYGFGATPAALGCRLKGRFNATDLDLGTLAPVSITDGADGAPDTLRMLGSSKANYSLPYLVGKHEPDDATFSINTALGVSAGDLMVAVPRQWDVANWCSVFAVTGIVGGANQLEHKEGVGGSAWNQAAAGSIFPAAGYSESDSVLINLGQVGRSIDRSFTVTEANGLQQTSYELSAPTTPIVESLFPNIVQLQAYYGKDTTVPADGTVDAYDTTAPTTQADWAKVLAIRVAVVARSAQREKEEVTAAAPVWDVGSAAPVAGSVACASPAGSKCVSLKLGEAGDDEWKHYRYKVFDTVVPLRNVLWHS